MEKLSPGKFEITLAGETKSILVSLGLKTELLRLLTKTQLDAAKAQSRVFLSDEFSKALEEKNAQIATLEAEEASEDKISDVRNQLEILYNQAIEDLQDRQAEAFSAAALDKIDILQESFSKALVLLLSERDSKGQIVNKVSEEEIIWGEAYAEAQEELFSLLEAVVEYITSALKKISAINSLVQNVSEPVEKKKD